MSIIHHAWGMKWTLVFAVLFGIFIAPTSNSGVHSIYGVYDSMYPPVKMQGTLVEKSMDYAIVHIEGENLRQCKFIQMDSYSRRDGYLRYTSEMPFNQASYDANTRPLGTFDMGNWKVWPTKGADAVFLYMEHDCDNRIVVTKVAEVSLL